MAPHPDPLCDLAHGVGTPPDDARTLVAVFASPVAAHLLHFARHVGYRTVLVDPKPPTDAPWADQVRDTLDPSIVDSTADVVVTDHDRPELGAVLRDALALPARWIGVMGSVRHIAPHVAALRELGSSDADIARVQRTRRLDPSARRAGGYDVVSPARAAADAARTLNDLPAVRAIVAEAVGRGWTTIPALRRELDLAGASRTRTLRLALRELCETR